MIEIKEKEIILECNKNYIILVLNCTLKNSKRIVLVSKIKRRDETII